MADIPAGITILQQARIESARVTALIDEYLAAAAPPVPTPPTPTPAPAPPPVPAPLYAVRTDRDVAPKPAPPALGPAGFSFTDPVFGSRLTRLTDSKTGELSTAFRMPSNASVNPWSADGAHCYVVDQWLNPYIVDITGQTPPYRVQGSNVEPSFSFVDPNLLGVVNGRTVETYGLSTKTLTTILDLDAQYPTLALKNTYVGGLHVADDDVWAVFFGGGAQDQHRYVHHSKGLLLDTMASATGLAPFRIHAASLDRTGRYMVLYPRTQDAKALGAPPGVEPIVLWDTATGTVTVTSYASGGHWSVGYGCAVNVDCPPNTAWNFPMWLSRDLSALDMVTKLDTPPLPAHVYGDDHTSWRNAKPGAKLPILSATFRPPTDVEAWRAWDDEILMVATDGSDTVYRFCHHQSVQDEEFWNQPLAAVNPAGTLAVFTSNWGKTVGAGRQDVFSVELK